MFAGTLGTPYSQPGMIAPGYAVTRGQAQWLGPFVATVPGVTLNLQPGQTITPGATVAAQLAGSDPSWWWAH